MTVSTAMEGSSYSLKKAILIYQRSGGTGFTQRDRTAHGTLASVHDIHAGEDGRAVIGAGRPCSEKGMRELKEAFDGRQEPQFLPEHVLVSAPDELIWHVKPTRRVHFFSSRANDTLEALDGALLPTPGLVFKASRRGHASPGLSVWAVRQRGRPDPNTILYHAPFFNVNGQGRVCHGSMKTPGTCESHAAEGWTDGFFASSFTHGSGVRFLKGEPGYDETLAKLAGEGEGARFPTQRLRRTGSRLRDKIGN